MADSLAPPRTQKSIRSTTLTLPQNPVPESHRLFVAPWLAAIEPWQLPQLGPP